MNVITNEIEITAPPQAVWDVIMDPSRFGEWVTIHRAVKLQSPDPAAAGARMEQDMHLNGVNFRVRWTLAEVRAPEFAEWQGRGPAFSKALIRYQLRPTATGTTAFTYTNEFSTPGGPLADLANRFVVGRASEHEARRSLAQLKALIEQRTNA